MTGQVSYRGLRPDEVGEAAGLFATSVWDLARRNGLPPPTAYTAESMTPLFAHLRATGIFEVAEVDGRLSAIACAIVREERWFLSMFWALPELQRRGIGRPLLERVRAEGARRGARVFATWSSIDFAAVGLYLDAGLYPGGPIFTVGGAPRRLPALPAGVEVTPLAPEELAGCDRAAVGVARPEDLAHLAARGAEAFGVRRAGRLAGYFLVTGGAIGPGAVAEGEDPESVLGAALAAAAARAPEVRLVALGVNQGALRAARAAGLRIVGAAHLLRSAPFAQLERYLPSGPALF